MNNAEHGQLFTFLEYSLPLGSVRRCLPIKFCVCFNCWILMRQAPCGICVMAEYPGG